MVDGYAGSALILSSFISIGYSVITGFIARAIGKNDPGAFWWGFFLGIIGIVIVALLQNKTVVVSKDKNTSSSRTAELNDDDSDNIEQIEIKLTRLKEMRDKNIITEEEYVQQRKKVLDI